MPLPTGTRLPLSSLITLRPVEGAFLNLTEINVDIRIQALLSYGPNFIVPGCSKLVDVVGSLEKLHWDLSQQSGVQDATQFFREIYNTYYAQLREALRSRQATYTERLLLESLHVTRAFFLTNKDVCVVQADKGQRTVLMYKVDYKSKMQDYITKCLAAGKYVELSDFEGRMRVIVAAYKGLRKQLKQLFAYVPGSVASRTNNPVPYKIWRRLLSDTEFHLPALYGTIKCHKEDKPVRPICASHSWYSNPIQGVICAALKRGVSDMLCKQNVRNISDVVPELHKVLLCEGYVFVKYDVRDMYGSMDRRSVYNYLVELIEYPEYQSFMPPRLLQSLIRFSLETSAIFGYDGAKYSQVQGLPQGARDSGLYATIYLDRMIQTHYSLLFRDNQIVYWWKYMDDFLLYAPQNKITSFKETFERVTGLELEVEHEEPCQEGHKISFLDINIYRSGMRIDTCMYQKSCASMRMINYMSACMPSYKYNTIISFIKTILKRVTNKFLLKDLQYLEAKLQANGYPEMYTRKYFVKVLAKEMHSLRRGQATLRMKPQEYEQRVRILQQFMQRFNYGTMKMSAMMRRAATEVTPPQMPRLMSVYNFCSVALSRFLAIVSQHYHMPMPVFRRYRRIYTAMRAVTAQRVSRRENAYILGDAPLRMAVVTCMDCNTVFLLSGRGNMEDVYNIEREREHTDLWRHMTEYRHRLSPSCHLLPTSISASSEDYSYMYMLYAAMYSSAGIQCDESSLRGLPGYLRIFFDRMRTLPNVINLGLPMPARVHRGERNNIRSLANNPSISIDLTN